MTKELVRGFESAIKAVRGGNFGPATEPPTAEKLKAYRLEHNLSQDQLARRLNVSVASVQSWELNRRQPRRKAQQQIRELIK